MISLRLAHGFSSCSSPLHKHGADSCLSVSWPPFSSSSVKFLTGRTSSLCWRNLPVLLRRRESISKKSKKGILPTPRCSSSSNSNDNSRESSNKEKTPFGYTRKDVLLIGVGVTVLGYGLKSGLEFVGVDPLQAGNVVQLVLVLGLTVGWISTYIFRVSNKEMTYAQQLRDYENKVMEKRMESLSEAEVEALLEQVEEEKRRLARGEQIN